MPDDVPRPAVLEALAIPPEIRDDMLALIRSAGGQVWGRPGLSPAQRSTITIAVLTALGRNDQLRTHIGLGLDNGLTRSDICEVIMHVAVYGGFPAAVSGLGVASSAFAERD